MRPLNYRPLYNLVTKSDQFVIELDRLFRAIRAASEITPLVLREFVNADSGNVIRQLYDGNKVDYDYCFIKTDSTGNTVTITPFGTQLINAASTLTLSSQGDSAVLVFDKATQTWWTI